MNINTVRETIYDIGHFRNVVYDKSEEYYIGNKLGIEFGYVKICINFEITGIYIDFYFAGYNLYGSYKLDDITKLIIIEELNKFIKTDKIRVLYRDFRIEEIIK